MKLQSTLFALLATTFIYAQPTVQWDNTIGGSGMDFLYGIEQTTDGGYIVGGGSWSDISGDKSENSIGAQDYWVMKTNSSGVVQWENTIGGDAYDALNSIQQTTDGGYIAGGWSTSDISGDKTENNQGIQDYWVVKLSGTGTIQWQHSIGGSGSNILQSVRQTSDGGYILGGVSDSGISGDKTEASLGRDYWVVKLNGTGVIQWENTIGGSGEEELYSIKQTTDGGYILGGYSPSGISGDKTEASRGGDDYWVVKLDGSGVVQWDKTVGGSGVEMLYSVQQATDGGYILAGLSESGISGDKTEANIGGEDYWVVKLNSTGVVQWDNTIGGNGLDVLESVDTTSDGGYILGGRSSSNISGDKTEASKGGNDYWVVKINASGAIQWQKTVGGGVDDQLFSIMQTSDDGYILGGFSKSGISGDKTEANLGSEDYWLVKLSAYSGIDNRTGDNSDTQVYPNPTTGTFTVQRATGTIEVLDIFGRHLLSTTNPQVDMSGYAKGVYLVRVGEVVRKLVLR